MRTKRKRPAYIDPGSPLWIMLHGTSVTILRMFRLNTVTFSVTRPFSSSLQGVFLGSVVFKWLLVTQSVCRAKRYGYLKMRDGCQTPFPLSFPIPPPPFFLFPFPFPFSFSSPFSLFLFLARSVVTWKGPAGMYLALLRWFCASRPVFRRSVCVCPPVFFRRLSSAFVVILVGFLRCLLFGSAFRSFVSEFVPRVFMVGRLLVK